MNYALIVLEATLRNLKKREYPWLIKKLGGDKAHNKRIMQIEEAIILVKKHETEKIKIL